MFDSHGRRKPRTTSFNNQQPSKQECSKLFPKMGPKMGPKTGPKTGTKIGTELGACFLFLINKAQNWPPKRVPKMNPKTGPKTGPKSSPQNEFKHKQSRPNHVKLSGLALAHPDEHAQADAAWILSKLLDTSCLQALTRNKLHHQLPTSSHFFSTTVAARLGKTKHACNHDYEKLRPKFAAPSFEQPVQKQSLA